MVEVVPIRPDTSELSCEQEECIYLNPDIETSFEGSLEVLDGLNEEFVKQYQVIRDSAAEIFEAEENHFQELKDITANRGAKRFFARSDRAKFEELRRNEREKLKFTIESSLGIDWDSFPATATDIDDLKDLKREIQFLQTFKVYDIVSILTSEDHKLQIGYKNALLAECIARTSLAIFQANYPALANILYCPDNLKEMPEPIQRIIAADIQRGESDSVVLQFKRRQEAPEEDDETRPDTFDCLTCGTLTKDAKAFFHAVSLGASAMGACKCPANEFGLCKRIMDRIAIPEEIQKELDKKRHSKIRDEITLLKHFAASLGKDPLKLKGKSKLIPTEDTTVGSKKKRKKNMPVDETPTERHEADSIESMPFSRLVVQLPGVGEISFDITDGQSVSEAVRTVLSSDIFDKYISRHNSRGIKEFFEQAVNTILFSPSYTSETSIMKIVTSPEYSIFQNKAHLYRLSGNQLIGAGGGPVGRATRIFFIPISEGDSRTVLFSGVLHKNELTKGVPDSILHCWQCYYDRR